jgi:hypothetical protein
MEGRGRGSLPVTASSVGTSIVDDLKSCRVWVAVRIGEGVGLEAHVLSTGLDLYPARNASNDGRRMSTLSKPLQSSWPSY